METEYLVCILSAKDNSQQQKKCSKNRGSCFNSTSYNNCQIEYNQCFEFCGGTVSNINEE